MKRNFISDLYVKCSLKVSHFDSPATTMSDCCQASATNAVVMPDGKKMWRCNAHEGVIDFRTGETGKVVYSILLKE